MRIRIAKAIDKPIMVEYDDGSIEHFASVSIHDENATELARIVYAPEAPLSDGTRVWIDVSPLAEIESNDDPNRP